jgi:hypothetical protein
MHQLYTSRPSLFPIPYTLHPITYALYHPISPPTSWSHAPALHFKALTIPYTLYPIPYTLYPVTYTLYPTPYTLHPIPYTLYPIPYITLYHPISPPTSHLLMRKRSRRSGDHPVA